MVLYLIVIALFYVITAATNTLLIYFKVIDFNNMFLPLWWTFLLVLACILVDAICVSFCRYVTPKKLYLPEKKCFKVKDFEKKLYEKLGVKWLKDHIPELGKLFVGFNKSEIKDSNDPDYIYEFLIETCYAEVMHVLSLFASAAIVFMCPKALWLSMGLPIAMGNVILNFFPIITQRYNRPKLYRLYERLVKRKNKNESK